MACVKAPYKALLAAVALCGCVEAAVLRQRMRSSASGFEDGASGTRAVPQGHEPPRPHIVLILADDLGWNGVGYHNPQLRTPSIDGLRDQGVRLEAHYTYKSCAPARASLLTGRYPFKMEATRHNFPPFTRDGTDLGYKMLPQSLKDAGYKTHMVGKWHQGFYMPEYTPTYRGFDTFFGYLGGGEDHYTQSAFVKCGTKHVTDLVEATEEDPDPRPVQDARLGSYNDLSFTKAAVDIIEAHDGQVDAPLFLFLSLQNTHFPVQAPDSMIAQWNFSLKLQNTYNAMVDVVDHTVGEVEAALKRQSMWNNSLLVFTSDNGACVRSGGSNHPFKGGKGSDWEGGIRVPAIFAGGVVPLGAQGKIVQEMFSIADWYATFAGLAGAKVDNDGLSPSDSIDQWSFLVTGVGAPPRKELVIDHWQFGEEEESTHGALRQGKWKLMVGKHGGASWFGRFSPNATFKQEKKNVSMCAVGAPCLFDIVADAGEHEDLAAKYPEVVASMMSRWRELSEEHHPLGTEMPTDGDAACAAFEKVGKYMVPWVAMGTPKDLPLPGNSRGALLFSGAPLADPGDIDFESPELIY